MRPAPAALICILAACAPPTVKLGDDTGTSGGGSGDPAIQIIHPLQDQLVELNADCSLSLFVAVDIDNLTVVPPGDLVDGEGHWHVELLNVDNNYDAVDKQFYDMERDGPLSAGPATISGTLVNSQHIDLGGEGTVAIVEFDLVAPNGASCP